MTGVSATFIPFGVAAGVAALAAAIYVSKKSNGRDIDIPTPETKRADLRYGYYGCFGDQVAEVKEHTNLHWEAFFEGEEKSIADMRSAGCAAVVDVMCYVFDRTAPNAPVTLRSDADARLRGLFDRLRAAGVLSQVRLIVPCDEPNLPATSACDALPGAVATIRAAMSSYQELAQTLLGCIYYSGKPKCHTNLFDVVGYDDYPAKSGMLAPGGDYEQFRATLRPDQKTILLPGGYIGQDPTPFVNYAQGHAEVWAVVPFIWCIPADNSEGITGIRDLPVRDAYVSAGRSICEQGA